MKQNGYFLIKIKKTINLLLWAKTEDELKDMCKKDCMIVPYFKDNDHGYILVDNKRIAIS